MSTLKSPLSDENRRTVGEALQGALVDLVDLSLVAKQVHWTVVGPRFRSVHLQLDEVVGTARQHMDIVAERASAIGVAPDGRAGTVSKTSGIDSVREGWCDDTEAVRTLIAALQAIIRRMRERIDVTAEPDPVTQDIIIGLTRDLEKHHWMFQAENVSGPQG
ncbi:Dps family protein [Streptomyces sp. XD-27]|uniref:Dps family protein n=1 Tax=Streptomyces sp. XD-27 TaxID=3062779 RepID=UPI0026F44174|nr:DNA starvation/stationary phase protection protein [Streptomyces sp. XD-27]WKX72942.1 DNA starvation/stationary phase protection protein [Streptomyces sp. XD-27]